MEKTIAAISTGLQPSGICIVRMSGPEALSIADKAWHGAGKNPSDAGKKPLISKMKSHTVHHGFISDGESDIDEVLVTVMRGPHTYTGEDTVEINCHGGILVARKTLELLLNRGASAAEPGEFTKRAFLNGRMDLSKAEAVIDVIEAKNGFALKASVSQLKGSVSEKIREIREKILDEISFIEAALDDPEHYDLTGYGQKLEKEVSSILGELREMIRRADYGSILTEGIRTAISGRPNAGKSSLLNALSGSEKAIVTEIAGTTRDVMEVPVLLGNVSLILLDTAGIRETDDVVEKIGVDRAIKAIESADLVLHLIDAAEGKISDEDRNVLKKTSDKKVIVLLNKSDLEAAAENEEKLRSEMEKIRPGCRVLSVSALSEQGVRVLEDTIEELYNAEALSYNDQAVITNARQKELLRNAADSLDIVMDGITQEMSEEFLAMDLTEAYSSLGKIIGEEVGEDVINRIFEKFCMGK